MLFNKKADDSNNLNESYTNTPVLFLEAIEASFIDLPLT
jgi:hypothetical protein